MPNGRLLPSISGLEDVPEAEAANVTIVRAVSDLKMCVHIIRFVVIVFHEKQYMCQILCKFTKNILNDDCSHLYP